MTIAERIYQTVKDMPEVQAAQVLDFAAQLRAEHQAPVTPLAPEEAAALGAELQTMVESHPPYAESVGDFVRRLRDGTHQ